MMTAIASTTRRKNESAAGGRLWLEWVLTGIAAGIAALAMAAETPPFAAGFATSGDEADTSGYAVAWAVALAGLLTGATLGAVQKLVLRGRLARLKGWVWASAAGFAVAFTAVWASSGAQHGTLAHHALPHAVDLAGPLGGVVIGTAFGASQWVVLRRQMRGAGWWVPANAAGFGGGWVLAAATPVNDVPAHFVGGAVVGLTLAATTGLVLVWLLRRPGLEKKCRE
jgi:hypothetical protein